MFALKRVRKEERRSERIPGAMRRGPHWLLVHRLAALIIWYGLVKQPLRPPTSFGALAFLCYIYLYIYIYTHNHPTNYIRNIFTTMCTNNISAISVGKQ